MVEDERGDVQALEGDGVSACTSYSPTVWRSAREPGGAMTAKTAEAILEARTEKGISVSPREAGALLDKGELRLFRVRASIWREATFHVAAGTEEQACDLVGNEPDVDIVDDAEDVGPATSDEPEIVDRDER